MILVIDIGNTTIAFTGIAGEDRGDGVLQGMDLKILFEAKLPTETGRDLPRFLKEAEQLLGQHGLVFSSFAAKKIIAAKETTAVEKISAGCF